MSAPETATTSRSRVWIVMILLVMLLMAMRLPSIAQPAGNDQHLYAYAAQRVIEGGVPYVDAWDHKPPGIVFVYALLWTLHPHERVIAIADTVAAGLVAWLLVILGRRTFGGTSGWAAAAIFLLLGHPSIARVSGVYVRGQCEVFIALAVTAALVLLADRRPRAWPVACAGLLLGAAFWLKYNALAYALPIGVAAIVWRYQAAWSRDWLRDLVWCSAGFLLVSAVVLGYFQAHGAVGELWTSTIEYNLRYSGETYAGVASAVLYPLLMPLRHARIDLLWFIGGVGALLLATRVRQSRDGVVVLAWLVAAVVSIAVNSARNLPQYFVQAAPAMAFAAAAGLATLRTQPSLVRLAAALLLVAGIWRVGVESSLPGGVKLGGLPQLAANIGFDLQYLTGRVDRATYLRRFKGEQKYDAFEVDALVTRVRTTTQPDDRILVFGFSPGVYVNSHRRSASRFFWSRPVVIEFGAGRPGYGSAGLLQDLAAHPPVLVALQKKDWGGGEPNSQEFFLGHPALRAWLDASYDIEQDTPFFQIWRRRT